MCHVYDTYDTISDQYKNRNNKRNKKYLYLRFSCVIVQALVMHCEH